MKPKKTNNQPHSETWQSAETEFQQALQKMGACFETFRLFQKFVWTYYRENRRDFSWRNRITPYRIFVSEVMLQQTQAPRVVEKFAEFMRAFPSWRALSSASLADVLKVWSGLGYNRRGKMLHEAAKIVVARHGGKLPNDEAALIALPGIGAATAGSIRAFAFNERTIFIETNIRAVFIHYFLHDKRDVADAEVCALAAQTVDDKNPREWYYALMDLGVYLKKTHKNPSRKSKHYVRQSRFKGSRRELRGMLVKALVSGPKTYAYLLAMSERDESDVAQCLEDLEAEGMIELSAGAYAIAAK